MHHLSQVMTAHNAPGARSVVKHNWLVKRSCQKHFCMDQVLLTVCRRQQHNQSRIGCAMHKSVQAVQINDVAALLCGCLQASVSRPHPEESSTKLETLLYDC